jgi:phage tail-like protein
MTQAQSSQSFSLLLTPSPIPEAIPATGTRQSSDSKECRLLLRPGEPSELIVQVKSCDRDPLSVTLEVEGDFPIAWCRIGTEGSEIRPGQQMDAVLHFQIEAAFFENQAALRARIREYYSGCDAELTTAKNFDAVLRLDYQGRLIVRSQHQGRQQIEFAPFTLHIRPHSLYLEFLPALYQEIDFVGRFLKIFEETFEPTVHTLESLWAYLDPLTAPVQLLPFLAHWVGLQTPAYLAMERQRFLIRNAMQIYRWRGTKRGLRFYLHLATGLPLDQDITEETDKHITILESFDRGFVTGVTKLGEDAILGGGRPYHFSVRLRCDSPECRIDEALVRQVIDQEKPAFCSYDLQIAEFTPENLPFEPAALAVILP